MSGDPVPANKDFAGGEGDQVASASEVDVLNSLSKRRRELDKREGQLTTQANMIAAAEAARGRQDRPAQAASDPDHRSFLGQRDDAQKAQVAALVKTYSIMKPKDAARIFNSLPDEVLVPVARDMKSDQSGAGAGQHESRHRQDADDQAGEPADPAPDRGCCRAPALPPAAHRRRGFRRAGPRCGTKPSSAKDLRDNA